MNGDCRKTPIRFRIVSDIKEERMNYEYSTQRREDAKEIFLWLKPELVRRASLHANTYKLRSEHAVWF